MSTQLETFDAQKETFDHLLDVLASCQVRRLPSPRVSCCVQQIQEGRLSRDANKSEKTIACAGGGEGGAAPGKPFTLGRRCARPIDQACTVNMPPPYLILASVERVYRQKSPWKSIWNPFD